MFKITPEAFGLDLADNSIKIAQLKKGRARLDLAAFVNLPLPPGLIKQGEILKPQELIPLVKKAVLTIKGRTLKTKYVLASLPEEQSFVRVIPLPLMKKQEINQAIQWEIESHIPLSREEVYLDWQLIRPFQPQNKQVFILVTATPKELVNTYTSLLEEAGLMPLGLEVESIAIARALIPQKDIFAPVPILDIGSQQTSFLIYSGQTLCFTSTIPLGGDHLTQAISQKLSLNFQEAEKIKIDIGLNQKKNPKIVTAVKPVLDDLAVQIKKYLDFFIHQCPLGYAPCDAIGKIFLCGGGARLFGLTTQLAMALKIPTELGNPWINILKPPLKSVPQLSFTESLGFTTSLGLALAACNLLL